MNGLTILAATDEVAQNLSILEPASPSAKAIVNLAILAVAVFLLILLVVEGILLFSVWRFRQRPELTGEPAQVYGSQPIEVAWTAAPTMIVFFLVLVITRTLWEVKAAPPEPKLDDHALHVTVTGRQWWWEYSYENYNGRKLRFVTANELHIPVSEQDQPWTTHLKLESADVCHSFWVPRLGGKMDLIPGKTNTLALQTTEAGLYVGQCAEYCGTQHANMLIRVVVDSPEEFEHWLEEQSQPAADDPTLREDKQVFLSQTCINCHRVRGTPADGNYAPDLTHLMSRETLASGLIPNTPENLTQWVRDPQSIKSGCLMPAFGLSESEVQSIVRYLSSLH